jgi:hypothetical protein
MAISVEMKMALVGKKPTRLSHCGQLPESETFQQKTFKGILK